MRWMAALPYAYIHMTPLHHEAFAITGDPDGCACNRSVTNATRAACNFRAFTAPRNAGSLRDHSPKPASPEARERGAPDEHLDEVQGQGAARDRDGRRRPGRGTRPPREKTEHQDQRSGRPPGDVAAKPG